ncbi:NAD(P)/FAD-dependent oxidoreductase [Mesorhizobium sp. NPDC059025]|uniref:NAD(P)/FAD-dependent oxidoreductase n=1 Tax=unclassified Mesorhizobium TaxID=325217 RepID=UPI003679B95E
MKIAVVGAGIVGASIAYHLAKQGAKVSIFDPLPPGSAVSGSSFACLNAFGRSGEDLAFRLQAIRYHRALASEIGSEHLLHLCGTLRMASAGDPAAKLARDAASFASAGGEVRSVTAKEMIDLEPRIHARFASERFSVAEEGWVDAGALCRLLVKTAVERFGAQFRSARVAGIQASDRWVRLSWQSDFETFDRVVLAAGNDTNSLLKLAGLRELPVKTLPGPLLVLTTQDTTVIRHVVYADGFHIRPGRGGYMAGVSALPGELEHFKRLEEERLDLLAAGARWLDGFLQVPRHWTTCPRPMPASDHPIVGPREECAAISVAAMHGGVTLAPLIGKLAASEIAVALGGPRSIGRAPTHSPHLLSEREQLPSAWQAASA